MKTAKLFLHEGDQAVRLPKEFTFHGEEVIIKQSSNAVVLLPLNDPWRPLQTSMDTFSDDFMVNRNQPETQKR